MPSKPNTPDQISRAVGALLAAATVLPGFEILLTPEFIDRCRHFARSLALWGKTTNLTAQPSDPSEIAFHILDSLAPLRLPASSGDYHEGFATGSQVLDIGSGAGFPGLILAASTPATFTLAEARRRRASFLTLTAAEMGLRNVRVLNVALSRDNVPGGFAIALSRAYGTGMNFFAIAARALNPGGHALLFLNPDQPVDLAAAHTCGFAHFRHAAYGVPRATDTVARVLDILRLEQPAP